MPPPPPAKQWTIKNIVIHYDFGEKFSFHKLLCDKDFSFEPELFPAALISKWSPAHVTLFPNGKAMLTGIKSESEAVSVINKIPSFLKSKLALDQRL